jgi:hypothetical protein
MHMYFGHIPNLRNLNKKKKKKKKKKESKTDNERPQIFKPPLPGSIKFLSNFAYCGSVANLDTMQFLHMCSPLILIFVRI